MEIGVELFAGGIEGFYVVFKEGLEELPLCHFDTRMEILEILCMGLCKSFRGFFREGGRGYGLECDCENVYGLKEVSGEFSYCKVACLLLLACRIPLQIDKVGLKIP
jgi:hypothetical protein